MTAYYNEIDEYAAAWLRNLIDAGHIAPGVVDTRSIVDVRPEDLEGYTQVHFFAGIGGWSLAARLAGWPDSRKLWTGSCPCQPFSAAGKRKGTADERHLWPEMRRLVAAGRPDVVAGEQVASKDGRLWLSGVRADLEDMAYVPWAADICSAGTGAPHIRQRIWWLADATGERRTGQRVLLRPEASGRDAPGILEAARSGAPDRLADTDGGLAGDRGIQRGGQHGQQQEDGGVVERLEHAASDGREQRRTESSGRGAVGGCGAGGLGDAHVQGPARDTLRLLGSSPDRRAEAGRDSFWSWYDVVHCTDGKARRFEPGSFPLAHGVSNRVGRLRAYGNAINPWLAAEVLGAYLDGERLRLTDVSAMATDGVFA